MIKRKEFEDTPMGSALRELAEEMKKRQMPPVSLNVIGGFALMLRGHREITDITDIDYVGISLYEDLERLSQQIGLKHGMEPGWINNDGMLTGDSVEDFTLSTGELHFEEAFSIGPVTINVLEEQDLLRLKIIAIDTAMTEMDVSGEYARTKDFADVKTLMDAQNMTPEKIWKTFGSYILCKKETMNLITDIYERGPEAAADRIAEKQTEFDVKRASAYRRMPYVASVIDNLFDTYKKTELQENDLDFGENTMEIT